MKCEKCSIEFEGTTCPNGCETKKKKVKKPIYKRWWFWTIMILFVLTVGLSTTDVEDENQVDTPDQTVNQTDNNENSENENTEKAPEKTPAQSKTEYIASCETVAYDDIARYPDNYKGKNVKFKGKVIQVSEGFLSSKTTYRIEVTEDKYGYWDDPVWVEYKIPEGSANILEEDIVTFYGECTGTTSYTSVLGSKITIPAVEAKYIDIEQ